VRTIERTGRNFVLRHMVVSMGAIWWGTRGTCPPYFFTRWRYNMPLSPTFSLLVLYLERFQK